ncbi:Ferric reductase, NADH/NADPH oxidase and related proteins [Phaffia rhodozyma]|uniref:ferric-chelate reductase (NADPH) n=1 Tax=Phaffia rhodozyma TaxID=264483 RepID=A0A0F7SRY1_PHARH|nr:Ferric reductase, NADH/NADPH oxidase and related proteins [Phaffia rhodozyma]
MATTSNAATIATIVTGGYTPPLATTASVVASAGTAIVSTVLKTTAGTTTRKTSTDTYWAAATATGPASPTVPPRADDHDYVTAYLSIHQLSSPSIRYAYTLYFIFALVLVLLSLGHRFGTGRGTPGAIWRKFSVRRIIIKRTTLSKTSTVTGERPRRKQPFSFPSNGQIVSIFFLFAFTLIFCFIGADYIFPNAHLFDYRTSFVKRATTPTVNLTPSYTIDKAFWTSGARTGSIAFSLFPLSVLFALKSPPFAIFSLKLLTHMFYDTLTLLHKWSGRLVWLVTALHVALWSVQLARDDRNDGSDRKVAQVVWIYDKFIWGAVSFILLSLLTVFSLQPVRKRFYEAFYFAHVTLVPLTLITSALHFPKLYWWPLAAGGLWMAERLWRFIRYGWVNGWWGGLGNNQVKRSKRSKLGSTLLPAEDQDNGNGLAYPDKRSSNHTFGKKDEDYEMTRLGVDTSAGLGVAQDGILTHYELTSPTSPSQDRSFDTIDSVGYDVQQLTHPSDNPNRYSSMIMSSNQSSKNYPHRLSYTQGLLSNVMNDGSDGFLSGDRSEHESLQKSPSHSSLSPHSAPSSNFDNSYSYPPQLHSPPTNRHGPIRAESSFSFNAPPPDSRPIRAPIPAGYALAQVLPSRMIRLTLRLPRPFKWYPGQNVLLQIREISIWQSHPFSIVSVYDADEEQEIVLLVKARKGFTMDLWRETKSRMASGRSTESTSGEGLATYEKRSSYYFTSAATKLSTSKPVFFRALVDGPYGSSARVRWGQHSTVLIVCGGSGVSFGVAILAYVCECIAGRKKHGEKGKGGKGFITRRVRFVWIVREFAEILWVSNLIRKSIDLVPAPELTIDIFVTNYGPVSEKSILFPNDGDAHVDAELAPPRPMFAKGIRSRSNSQDSIASALSIDSNADLGYLSGSSAAAGRGGSGLSDFSPGMSGDHRPDSVLELTNYDESQDEEDNERTAAERHLSLRVKKEGRIRRARSRKRAKSGKPSGFGLGSGLAAPPPLPVGPSAGSIGSGLSEYNHHHYQQQHAPMADPVVTLPAQSYLPFPQHHQQDHQQSLVLDQDTGVGTGSKPYRNKRESFASINTTDDVFRSEGARTPGAETFTDVSYIGAGSGSESTRRLVGGTWDEQRQSFVRVEKEGEDKDQFLDEGDEDDLNVVAEMARPGRPKLEKIIQEEVDCAEGTVVIASCGPSSLNSVVRNISSNLMNPKRAHKRLGHIAEIYTEEYGY